MRAMDDRIVRCGIISSCQSAATFEIVKALLATSLSYVRSAIASTGLNHCHYTIPYHILNKKEDGGQHTCAERRFVFFSK